MKKIILVAGNLNPLYSYEYNNFLKPLKGLGNHVTVFDFIESLRINGREKMNSNLLLLIKTHLPDLVIFFPHKDEFIPKIIEDIGKISITIGYLYDDMWRIKYSRFWAKHYHFITTSDPNGIEKFKKVGHTNVIYSPFSCNSDIYCKKELPKLYDVTFVGGYNPHREWYINYLIKKEIEVKVFGKGWGSEMLTIDEMVNVFNQSRINLNLSNSICWNPSYIFDIRRPFRKTLHIWKTNFLSIFQSDTKTNEQVKGRHFEINSCGGFQLSYFVNGLDDLYKIGNEIEVFTNPSDLVQKIKYYLKNEQERELISNNAFIQTRKKHTTKIRFEKILDHIRLSKDQTHK